MRTRYRNGDWDDPKLITPNESYRYEIVIGTTAIDFPKDHKIRLETSSSNFPRFDVNSNLAGRENDTGYIVSSQTIYHDKEHPSHLLLPIFMKDKKD